MKPDDGPLKAETCSLSIIDSPSIKTRYSCVRRYIPPIYLVECITEHNGNASHKYKNYGRGHINSQGPARGPNVRQHIWKKGAI
jgi:hypothetical protein